MAYPVFDLHCDTADRIGWATLDLDLRFTAGTDGYFPGDETHPQDFDLIEGNACAISARKDRQHAVGTVLRTLSRPRFPPPTPRASRRSHGAYERPGNAQPRPYGQRAQRRRHSPRAQGRQGRLHPHHRKRHVLCRGPRADRSAQELGRAYVVTQLEWRGAARERPRHPRRPHRRPASRHLRRWSTPAWYSTSPTSTMSALTRLSPTPRVPSSPATPTPVRFAASNATLPTTSSAPFATWAVSSASTTAASSFPTTQPTRPPQTSPSTS